MSGSSGSNQKGLKGGQWTGKLHFYPDTVSHSEEYIEIPSENLVAELEDYVGQHERILKADIFLSPLSDKQFTKLYFHHAFLILRTDQFWWSVEKYQDAIVMQRSENEENLMQKCRNVEREEINKILKDLHLANTIANYVIKHRHNDSKNFLCVLVGPSGLLQRIIYNFMWYDLCLLVIARFRARGLKLPEARKKIGKICKISGEKLGFSPQISCIILRWNAVNAVKLCKYYQKTKTTTWNYMWLMKRHNNSSRQLILFLMFLRELL